MTTFDYRSAGVDIDAGAALIERIKPLAAKTRRSEVLTGLGGFGGLFELPLDRYQHPVLVSGTDGVGTKLKLALQHHQHHTIGIDLVAMCVNDILVTGAEPLFFLDYYATGQLDVEQATAVISGIAEGCQQAGCTLIGGETAEMPGMYAGNDYDLAGFGVGIVEKAAILGPERVQVGDVLLALASSGPHANGYSLIRALVTHSGADLTQPCGNVTLAQALLEPTRIYVRAVQSVLDGCELHALAHITGGGITDNLPRVLPDNTKAIIERARWALPPVFRWLQQTGQIVDSEMLRTFNCGVGMILVLPAAQVATATQRLLAAGEQVWPIGEVVADSGVPSVEYCGEHPA